jgi:hypothetical protein
MVDSPLQVFIAWCLIKHRDNFTSYILPFQNVQSGYAELNWVPPQYKTTALCNSPLIGKQGEGQFYKCHTEARFCPNHIKVPLLCTLWNVHNSPCLSDTLTWSQPVKNVFTFNSTSEHVIRVPCSTVQSLHRVVWMTHLMATVNLTWASAWL